MVVVGAFFGWLMGCGPAKRTLIISTGQSGEMSRGAAESLLAVIDKDLPEVTFKPRPSKDSVESMLRLHPQQGRSERSELALIQNETVANQTEVRTILPLFEDMLHFIVPNGSEIMGVADLEGKRVAVGPPASGTAKFVKTLFEHYGIAKGEFDPQRLNIDDACTALKQGKLDAVLIVAGFKPAAVEDLFWDHGDQFRFVSLGQPAEVGDPVDGFLLTYPFAKRYLIPEGVYRTSVQGARRVAPS
ncbi:MAG: TAXI family TRAP transporter solute-binding subunit [Verrucomicrobiaceae bacterium]|nr:TAXI family TRAP transporter solute-binding subunit [Verrucomicrobiaceae bacterium]